ncbi:calpain-7-like isoform X2 [Halichondria panicea]|uniref:calpain-7-like isoform X2 n=1 Tax=Halichondria panicea TaxID=6063 RepID=UPI00312B914C
MEPPSPYAEQRYKDGLECARRATQFDQAGQYSAAFSFYSEAVEALNQACAIAPMFNPVKPRVLEYAKRAQQLSVYLNTPTRTQVAPSAHVANPHIERNKQKTLTNDEDRQNIKTLTMNALEQIEHLKTLPPPSKTVDIDDLVSQLENLAPPTKTLGHSTPGSSRSLPRGPLTSFLDADTDLTTPPKFDAFSSRTSPTPPSRHPPSHATLRHGGKPGKGSKFTEKEIKVLRATSSINGVTYFPLSDMDLTDLRRITPLPQDFEDPCGLIRLSDKQRSRLKAWVRPYEICDNPMMVHLISSFAIKQTLIADCSFVASLTVSADYERKFKTRLVTRLIHPQNRNGEPIMNPNGKYLVSFNLNGCRRKVEIDDRLPISNSGELLCSYSNNSDEFWVSLIEKAYMKVMGGYDFPGSSSNIDLHALTGWIPERAGLKETNNELFDKMEQSLRKGNALLTVATGELSEAQAERAGLVATHAYAILNVVQYKGLKLLQLKNPWSHKRWKGNYSEHDQTHWTPELRRALKFDQTQALEVDNGVFWIDWASLCKFFDVAYLNWKPELFAHKSTIHDVWKPNAAEKDWYDISNNPQYTLRVNNGGEGVATVWVLLSRHITAKNDFAHNEKFITLHIAKSDGKRIFYPEKFHVTGIKINTPHYLAKLENVPRGASSYTVIVSQLESLSTIYYTLRVYSTCDFTVSPVSIPYEFHQQISGQWFSGQSASPQFRITTTSYTSRVMIKLRAPKELYGRLELSCEAQDAKFSPIDTGSFRFGLSVLEAQGLPKALYSLLCISYSGNKLPPSKPVPFIVDVFCDNVFSLNAA